MISATQILLLFTASFLLTQCSPKLSNNSVGLNNKVNTTKGSEVAKVVALANAFKASLTPEQVKILQLAWSKADAARWSNLPEAYTHPARVGISFSQLDATQIKSAKALLAAVLDDKTLNEGFDESEGIQAADEVIGALPGKRPTFGAGNYFIAFLGEPSASALWELQFGGHHLAFSNTYKDGQLIGMTPSFRGIEPMSVMEANGRHYQPMEQERVAFKNILTQLSDAERSMAKLPQTYPDIMLGPGKDNAFPIMKEGLKVGLLSTQKQALILKAISLYVKDIKGPESDRIMAMYMRELADTYIGFSGSMDFEHVGDYIRIDGPGVWIEYNAQATRDIRTLPTHPHSIWRDHKSDYGGTW